MNSAPLHLRLIGLLTGLFLACRGLAQNSPETGTISGAVIETYYRRPLQGVAVLVRGTTLATTTGSDGNFSLEGVPPGEQVVVFSRSGYTTYVVTEVRVAPGQVTRVDNAMRPEFFEMDTFVVTATELGDQMQQLLFDRQQASALMDSIGSDFISKAGAGDAAEAMSKVTGVTVVEGKYVFVRGLGERYGITLLNGLEVPSADPDRRAVQLDAFPSDSIDRIETSKSFTPDMPGSFSGGAVNIITKKYPAEPFLNFSLGVGYNSQATFNKNFLTYNGGSTDWAGFDDGTRAVPDQWATSRDTLSLFEGTRSGGGRTPASRMAAANELKSLTTPFDDQMAPFKSAPGPDASFSASLGRQWTVFGKRLGFLAGVNYGRKFRFYDDGQFGRFQGDTLVLADKSEIQGASEVGWGSVVNIAYELHENHEIAFNFLYNRNTIDDVLERFGFDTNTPDDLFNTIFLHYTERDLQSFQLQGTHEFPEALEMTTAWSAAFSLTSQDEPDYRILEFTRDFSGRPDIPLSSALAPTHFFREIDEQNLNLKLDQTIPFTQWGGLEGEVKFGVYYSQTERDYQDRRFIYQTSSRPFRFDHFAQSGDPRDFARDELLTFTPTTFGAYQFNAYIVEQVPTLYQGGLDIGAGYGMVELPLVNRLRLVGGARYETSDLTIDATSPRVENTSIQNDDLLPALSLIYEMLDDMNFRLAYGRTLARPTFREIGPAYFDFVNAEIIVGNPDLQQTSIENYDFRWEWFPRPGELLALSAFYKHLEHPIEKAIVTRNGQVQYQNRDEATIYGLELETRTQLDVLSERLAYFNIGGNFTWIKSETDASDFEFDKAIRGIDTRPLQGQSPYVINADITYANPDTGTSGSVFYNVFGKSISEVSDVSHNVYQQPVQTLDFLLAQRLGKHTTIKFAAKNLLNPVIKKTVEFGGEEAIYHSYTRGRNFTLSFNFEF